MYYISAIDGDMYTLTSICDEKETVCRENLVPFVDGIVLGRNGFGNTVFTKEAVAATIYDMMVRTRYVISTLSSADNMRYSAVEKLLDSYTAVLDGVNFIDRPSKFIEMYNSGKLNTGFYMFCCSIASYDNSDSDWLDSRVSNPVVFETTDIDLSSCWLGYLDGRVFAYSNITKITLPEGLQTLGCASFGGCEKLQEVVLPDGLQHIDSYAFAVCKSLKQLHLPSSVEDIEVDAIETSGISLITFEGTYISDSLLESLKEAGFTYDAVSNTCTRVID